MMTAADPPNPLHLCGYHTPLILLSHLHKLSWVQPSLPALIPVLIFFSRDHNSQIKPDTPTDAGESEL